MLNKSVKRIIKPLSLLSFVGLSAWFISTSMNRTENDVTQSYIISSTNFELLKQQVKQLNVLPSHELAIINAVAVDLNQTQLSQFQQDPNVNITKNFQVELSSRRSKGKRKWQPESVVNGLINANYAHTTANFGGGVTIGFLDTGLDQLRTSRNGLGLASDLYGQDKFWGTYDSINNELSNYSNEESGHGTHVASIAGNSDHDASGKVYGVAPNAALVGIKAFDIDGKGTYADVIRGIDWAIEIKDVINLKVLNMSFSGPVRSYYWEDPLNQAVMKAWQAGIVVVASAGNTGPDPMTIGVPGNIPYIITVGAMTDNYTTSISNDDVVATFSSAGPTVEGFVKPDIVAPGGHLSGLMAFDTQIAIDHPEFHNGGRYFEMSGTSQAAAVVSGVVALMLTEDPTLSPDDVKCRLLDSAQAALTDTDELAYSVFQQGAGIINAKGALQSTALSCANQALDISQDLANNEHFYGPANIDDNGNFYIEGLGQEYVWDNTDSGLEGSGLLWRTFLDRETSIWQNTATTDGLLWRTDFQTDGLLWRTGFGVDGLLWRTSLIYGDTPTIATNNWVEPQ